MRGTPNTAAGKVTGDVFAAAHANDLTKIAVGADDDALAELLAFEPPAAVTATTPRVGFVPLRIGPVVTGSAFGRVVTVAPIRALRSSVDNAKPREALSGVSGEPTLVELPALVAAGTWRLELLYAELAYVDASKPERGTQVTFAFAPTGAGAAVAGAPTVATLPVNTSTTWNIPIAYVKNVGGAGAIATEDILEFPPAVVDGFAQDVQLRLSGKKTGIDARRAYASATHDPTKMVVGGTSALATLASLLTSTVTPAGVGRHNVEFAVREILLPKEITGGSGGVTAHVVVDDTRDWRGANFYSLWIVPKTTGQFFGEDDTGNGTSGTRLQPFINDGTLSSGLHFSAGQSWNAQPASTFGAGLLVAAELQTDTRLSGGSEFYTGNIGLTVDAATGALRFTRNTSGSGAGSAISVLLIAVFGNHRP